VKKPWQTFEEASGYMRPERVNKWPNSMIDDDDDEKANVDQDSLLTA
jgi:hypothetical protein